MKGFCFMMRREEGEEIGNDYVGIMIVEVAARRR